MHASLFLFFGKQWMRMGGVLLGNERHLLRLY
jgi:hypothetical protein